jgi:hypothetical protein
MPILGHWPGHHGIIESARDDYRQLKVQRNELFQYAGLLAELLERLACL